MLAQKAGVAVVTTTTPNDKNVSVMNNTTRHARSQAQNRLPSDMERPLVGQRAGCSVCSRQGEGELLRFLV